MAESTEQSPEPSKLFAHYAKSRSDGERVALEWKDVNYSMLIKDPKESKPLRPVYKVKRILRNMKGKVVSGQLLAIMGPTGCGKTSLLNVLAARVSDANSSSSELTGSVFVNGKKREEETFRRVSAYVLQDDRLYAHLTVTETLSYAAHFYLPDTISETDKKVLVNSVISELGLNKAKDTIIGDERIRGVSGGERKRANIGVQLISDPAVLFLDEPTSGLDSFQSQAVMESMRAMATHGRLVITVIHQPRSSIFEMFDQLLLLSEGRTIYLGPASSALKYFAACGYPAPAFFNPADYFLDILSPDTRSKEEELKTGTRILNLSEAWEEKGFQTVAEITAAMNGKPAPKAGDSGAASGTSSLGPGSETYGSIRTNDQAITLHRIWTNIRILTWRSFSGQIRVPMPIFVRLFFSIAFGCIIGGMYSNVSDDQKSIIQIEGLLFVIVINQGFNAALAVLATFPKEKLIVNRERANHAYDTFTYYASKFLAELPLNLLPPLIFGVLVYNVTGLPVSRLGAFLGILLFESTTALALGLLVSAASGSPDLAMAIGIPVVIISFIFGGFYINVRTLPIVANWFPYISFMKWSFQALCINQFKGTHFKCSGGPTGACLSTGEEILDSLAFGHHTVHYPLFGLAMVLIGLLVLGMVVLQRSQLRYMDLGHIGRNRGTKSAHLLDAEDNITPAVAARESAAVKGMKGAGSTTQSENGNEPGAVVNYDSIYK